MSVIDIKEFGGELPSLSARALPPNAAQENRNLFLGTTEFRPQMADLAAGTVTDSALDAERLAHQATKTEHTQAVATAARTALIQSEKYRTKEQELRDAEETHAQEVKTLHLDLGRARDRAALESRRVQNAANAAADRARAQCANTTPSELRPPADDPIGVLANVLGRADARAGELADVAEQRGIAGRACERAYDEARQALRD